MSRLPQTPYDTVLVSGGFDPAHIGHIRMILEAATYGNVIVVANSDAWLMRKKGYIFMPWEERAEILAAFRGVTSVVRVDDTDGTVCEAIRRLKPTYFANGGDRKTGNTPEMDVCKELGVQLLWNVGGGKIQSSSDLVRESGMVIATESDDPDLPLPSSVEILMSTKV
jgi:D-beta-D-heptose 7-phosphate kinase/D-beta-D-heptose 1-phosphate adenosyltransferase